MDSVCSLRMYGEDELRLISHLPATHQMLNGDSSHMLSQLGQLSQLKSEERQSSDRSVSATPSQNGEDNASQDLEDEHSRTIRNEESMEKEVSDIKKCSDPSDARDLQNGIIFMSHQMARIMKALHVPPCLCKVCAFQHLQLNKMDTIDDPAPLLRALFPTATPEQLNSLTALAARAPQQPSHHHHLQTQHSQLRMGQGYASLQGGGKVVTSTEKKMLADYAKVHGALAAAKRFGIPPPVSTYYQRKDSQQNMMSAVNNASPGPSSEGENENNENGCMPVLQPNQPTMTPVSQAQINQNQPPKPLSQPPASGPPTLHQRPTLPQMQPVHNQQISSSVPSSPMFGGIMDMSAMMKMNSSHSTGSPGFLRGRGRGRPKLIGDELDADLVDYMVTVKQADPHGHMTASQALTIAKQYILEKAPGLLEEHGGHVKLKLTWAMKLVSRIAERQKEIELGLPAGSLSNLGRHQLNNLPGGNFMADIMAQNIISQHVMMGMGNNQNGHTGSTSIDGKKDDMEHDDGHPPVGAPEIVNVKELNLNILKNIFGDKEGVAGEDMSGLIEGEMPAYNYEEQENEGEEMV